MTSIVILQARTNSSRLPAKVLLPVAGMPLVVLAAKRAASTGRTIKVATSSEPDDDELVTTLEKYGIPYYRGSLNDVLDRVVKAVAEYEDEATIVRLTGDNVLPDGGLIDEVDDDFRSRSLEYICCNGPASGLPYGMSVEITKVKHLREAAASSTSSYDREHVTPFVIRKYGLRHFEKYKYLNKGHYRCTVDLYEDYINICRVFSNAKDPISTSGMGLIDHLHGCMYQPLGEESVPKLVMGGAQLGMEYGIANLHGPPELSEAELILKTAIGNGIEYIDSARAYGLSEKVIGKCLAGGWSGRVKIITKVQPLEDLAEDADPKAVEARVDASIFESCAQLRRQSLDVVMLHRASHLKAWGGVVWHRLNEHKRAGVIKELGVSVQSPEELGNALSCRAVGFIQMPFNIIDWRWNTLQDQITNAKRSRNLVVHVRSVFLQGLLLSPDKALWRRAHIYEPEPIWEWLRRITHDLGFRDVADCCLRYVRSKPWVDGVVVGMERLEQAIKNIALFNLPEIAAGQVAAIESSRPLVPTESLDPSKWTKDEK